MAGFEPLSMATCPILASLIGAGVGFFVYLRACKSRARSYSWVAAIVLALMFGLMVWKYGVSVRALVYCALAVLLLVITLIDIDSMTIPNGFICAGIALWVLSLWWIGPPVSGFGVGSLFVKFAAWGFAAVLFDGILGAVVISGALLGFALLFEKLTGKASLGGGDVKLFFMVGLYLGLATSIFNLMLSCALGLIFSFVWTLLKARKRQEDENLTRTFPFGPAIAGSTLISLLVGFDLVAGYVGLLPG